MTTIDRRTVLASGAAALCRRDGCERARGRPGWRETGWSRAGDHHSIVGESEVFPVRRIYCIGRNYAAHCHRAGSVRTASRRFFFQKPDGCDPERRCRRGGRSSVSVADQEYHHEVELVAALNRRHQHPGREGARFHVYGYALAST